MSEVAARAGVSPMTVSYTYNKPDRVSPATRAKVLEAARELEYSGPDPHARSLRYGSSRTLGFIMGEHLTYAFDNEQATAFISGIADVCAERNHGLLLLPITGDSEDVERVAAAAVDGFVLWTTSEDDAVLDAVLRTRKPAAIQGGPARDGVSLVGVDDRAAARQVAMECFARARRPAVIGFPLDRDRDTRMERGLDPATATFPVTRHRLEGFRDAAIELGIEWSDVLVGVCATNDAREAESMAVTLLTGPAPVDAVAGMSDEIALGVVRAAEKLSVPGTELAISGWDNSAVAVEHELTTVDQDLREQGALCARIALGDVVTETPSWSIVQRASTQQALDQSV